MSIYQVYDGAKKYNWLLSRKPISSVERIVSEFDFGNKDYLNFKEFTYLNIRENIKTEIPSDCKFCFNLIKKDLQKFFKYLNCDESGFIKSEGIYRGMENMKLEFPVKASMVNSFALDAMEFDTATIDTVEFIYGMLVGMYERVVTPDGINVSVLKMMKETRLEQLKNGLGPT